METKVLNNINKLKTAKYATASARVIQCCDILNKWMDLFAIVLPKSLVNLVIDFALFVVSIKLAKSKHVKTDTSHAHRLHIRQIEVYQKLIDPNTNKLYEEKCKLRFFDGSKSMKPMQNANINDLTNGYITPLKCIDGDLSAESFNHNRSGTKEDNHWMEFEIMNSKIGHKNNISKIVIYNRKVRIHGEKIIGSKLHIIHDHNTIAETFDFNSQCSMYRFNVNPIKTVPSMVDALVVGWIKQLNITAFIANKELDIISSMIGLYYMDPIEDDRVYIVSAHNPSLEPEGMKYLEYRVTNIKLPLQLNSDFYAHSRTFLVCADSTKNSKYYMKVAYEGLVDDKYWGIVANKEDELVIGFKDDIKDAILFELKLFENKGFAPFFEIRYYDNDSDEMYFMTRELTGNSVVMYSGKSVRGIGQTVFRLLPNQFYETILKHDVISIYNNLNKRYFDLQVEEGTTADCWHHRMESRWKFHPCLSGGNDNVFYLQCLYPGARFMHWVGIDKYRIRMYENESKRAQVKFVRLDDKNDSDDTEAKYHIWVENKKENMGGWIVTSSHNLASSGPAQVYSLRPISRHLSFVFICDLSQ